MISVGAGMDVDLYGLQCTVGAGVDVDTDWV